MGYAVETLGQRIISRRPLSRFVQIDRLVTILTGAGTQTTLAFYLPRARYTVFPEADPERAATSFALLDEAGNGVRDDWSNIPPDVHGLGVPLVQPELPAGNYRLTIGTATPTCAWQVQVILNSMMSWAAPPPAYRPRLAPPDPIVLRHDGTREFRIAQTGHYALQFALGGMEPGDPARGKFRAELLERWHEILRSCSFNLDLRAADGHLVHLGDGRDGSARFPTGAFLGAGVWRVEIDTSCEWQLTIAPRVGPSGGGARWF